MSDLAFAQSAAPVSVFNETSGNQLAINSDGSINSNVIISTSVTASTLTNVAASATSVQLLASNTSRKMAIFYNDSNADLRIKFGTTASATSFTVLVTPDGYYQLPLPVYQGIIHGIWNTSNGTVRITELT